MKKIFTAIVFVALIVLFAGCSKFLEDIDPPNSKVASQVVFTSDATATSAIVGIYMNMQAGNSFASGYRASVTTLAGLSADELKNLPRTDYHIFEFDLNTLRQENSNILALWKSIYGIIYQANDAIEELNASTALSENVRKQLLGEALFVRAFCNFYLVNLFGDVPLITSTDYAANAKATRTPVETVYDKTEEDLLAAKDLLSEAYVKRDAFGPEERVRPNKFTATALLARVYLFRGKWLQAEEQASQVINNAGLYTLVSNLDNVFLKGSKEAIWQLAPIFTNFNTQEGLLFAGEWPSANVLTAGFVNSFEPTDNRKTKWIGTSGQNNFPYKYKQNVSPASSITEYSILFRLAEQYLIRAEARAMQDKLTGTNSAESDINSIRNRAGLANTTATGKATLLAAIEQERRIELFTEWGHRWFDLKRWNRATAVLGAVKTGWSASAVLYPLPLQEMDKNPFLKPQNVGY